jgi:hypothetical protein
MYLRPLMKFFLNKPDAVNKEQNPKQSELIENKKKS